MSAYQQAITYLEKAHLLIDGDHWRDHEVRLTDDRLP
jgi:hypothetical protein